MNTVNRGLPALGQFDITRIVNYGPPNKRSHEAGLKPERNLRTAQKAVGQSNASGSKDCNVRAWLILYANHPAEPSSHGALPAPGMFRDLGDPLQCGPDG